MVNKTQIRIIHAQLSKLPGIDRQVKESIVSEYSNGRCNSTKDLTYQEADKLIKDLQLQINATPEGKAAEKMRNKIIRMAHEIGWKQPNGSIDMKAVDTWCTTYGHGKKHLDSYRYEELPKLVSQFESGPYKHHIKRI